MEQLDKEDNSISFNYQDDAKQPLGINTSALTGVGSMVSRTSAVLGGSVNNNFSYYRTAGLNVQSTGNIVMTEEQMLNEIMNRVNTLSFQLESANKAFNELLQKINALSDERKGKRRKLEIKKEE